MKKGTMFLLSIMTILMFTGCKANSVLENKKVNVNEAVQIIVSKDFGNETVFDKNIPFEEDTSIMDIMQENFDIETAYGGGFVNAINGIKSGFTGAKEKRKRDWFYYVNGILSQVGAGDFYLKPDDVVIWDYHDWSNNMYMSSIIGAYPKNFICDDEDAVEKTEIRYDKTYENESKKLAVFLKDRGLTNLQLANLDGKDIANEKVNTIMIGTWDEMVKIDYIKELYENRKKVGLFFNMDNDIKALTFMGEVTKEYDKAAVIASIVKGYGSTGTLWLVTGNDENCIKRAVKLLYEKPEELRGKFAAIVTEQEILNIPTLN
jgi:hypothetical protein